MHNDTNDDDNEEWYIIKDFESFIDSTRALVFNNFGKQQDGSEDDLRLSVAPEEQDELNTVLSYNETKLIAEELLHKQTNKITKQTRYLVSDQDYHKLIDALHSRLVGNLLNGLVNKGLVESSFDDEVNDFVFWVKDDKAQEDPQTD